MLIFLLLSSVFLSSSTYSGKPFLSLSTATIPQETFPIVDSFNNSLKSLKNSDKKLKNLKITFFGGQTVKPDDITQYFLPFNKTKLRVREGLSTTTNPNIDNDAQDIVAQNFNIANKNSSFYSELSFKPKQIQAGVNLSAGIQLNNKWWVSCSAPIVHVKNTLDMVETVTFNGSTATTAVGFDNSTPSRTMEDAFRVSSMLYGKIDGAQKATRLSDITIDIGYNFRTEADYSLQQYFGLILPMGNKPKAQYLFEPIVGNNKHFVMQMGTLFDYNVYASKQRNIWLKVHTKTQYLFSNTQKRSIDLVGKPWSRYIAIFANNTKRLAGSSSMGDMTWGINYLTQDVKVSPHFLHEAVIALQSTCKNNYVGTLGYRCSVRQEETLQLENSWNQGPQVSNLDAGLSEVNPARGINNEYTDFTDATKTYYITEDQLDLHGAAHPFSVDHTLYASLARSFGCKSKKRFFEVGGNYTFGANNATPHRWQLLVNISTDF